MSKSELICIIGFVIEAIIAIKAFIDFFVRNVNVFSLRSLTLAGIIIGSLELILVHHQIWKREQRL